MREFLLSGFLLAALVTHCTGGFAGRLTGCLAFTASAGFHRRIQIPGIQRPYMLHIFCSFQNSSRARNKMDDIT